MAAILANFLHVALLTMAKLRAFIFGSVVDLYWDHTHTHTQKKLCSYGQNSQNYKFVKIYTFCKFFPMHNVLQDTHDNEFLLYYLYLCVFKMVPLSLTL